MSNFTAIILDAWECQLDSFGPFETVEQAENAAWEKWDGADGISIVILKTNT